MGDTVLISYNANATILFKSGTGNDDITMAGDGNAAINSTVEYRGGPARVCAQSRAPRQRRMRVKPPPARIYQPRAALAARPQNCCCEAA